MNGAAHVVVVGNEKGGSGKSTTAMHLMVSLLRMGRRVAAIDLDLRQRSLARYIENRRATAEEPGGRDLPIPTLADLTVSACPDPETAAAEDDGNLEALVAALAADHDVIVIDTPGNDTALSRSGHSFADTLITPLNDSFVDLDVLARVDRRNLSIAGPSHYAQMVWEQKMARARRDGGSVDWIVMRNRLSSLDARNKRDMERLIRDLSRRIGFRTVPGFGERVIYRELFHRGLTLMDLRDLAGEVSLSMSHLAARQEVRALVEAVRLP
ncbi:MAG: AAA family ATPase [Hyphomicrobiales bacterium]|nr:AAA family ATPase [Hyphomicrobiales bacterium]